MTHTLKLWLGWNPIEWAWFNRWMIPVPYRAYLQLGPVVIVWTEES